MGGGILSATRSRPLSDRLRHIAFRIEEELYAAILGHAMTQQTTFSHAARGFLWQGYLASRRGRDLRRQEFQKAALRGSRNSQRQRKGG